MIKVGYEKYWCDFHRQSEEMNFSTLEELENWIFSQMEVKYSDDGSHLMSFPTPVKVERIRENGPWTIEFTPTTTGPTIWIHQIEDENGIIFSDGKLTCGLRHWSKAVQEWLIHCDKRQHNPQFNFVE